MTAALETRGLGKRFGRHWALQDCTVHLPQGRVAGLVGPNGAGKSTLLQLAVGLLRPSSGEISVLGEEVTGSSAQLLERVAFVAQDTPLYRGFTTAETLDFGRHMNRRWDDSAVRPRLADLGIPLSRKVGQLSGGQQAQVALAVAVAKQPDLLVLDEPVARLDPLARRQFREVLMEAVADQGATVILSSHLISDLQDACDHLIVLVAGRTHLDGDLEGLLAEHRLLTGSRSDAPGIAQSHLIVESSHTDRQTTLLVRGRAPILDPHWDVRPVGLEEMVLAYLRAPHLPAAEPSHRSLEVVA